MIIELKDIPNIPIKKLDVHIEFSDSQVVTSSFLSPNVPEHRDIPKTLENVERVESTENREPRVLPEMENADF